MKVKARRIARVVFVAMLLVAMSTSAISMPAYAASNSTAKKAESAAKSLVRYAEYQGWTAEVGKTKTANGKATIVVKLHNSKSVFAPIKVVAKSGKKASYYFKGKKYGLKGWKVSLKKYAVSADKKAVVKAKARARADALEKYAKNEAWTITRSRSYKNGKAQEILKVTNPVTSKKIAVVTLRKKGAVSVSYKLGGKSSSAKAIKKWLSKNSAGEATVEGHGYAPADPPVDVSVDNPDFSGKNGDVDDSYTGEPTPSN